MAINGRMAVQAYAAAAGIVATSDTLKNHGNRIDAIAKVAAARGTAIIDSPLFGSADALSAKEWYLTACECCNRLGTLGADVNIDHIHGKTDAREAGEYLNRLILASADVSHFQILCAGCNQDKRDWTMAGRSPEAYIAHRRRVLGLA